MSPPRRSIPGAFPQPGAARPRGARRIGALGSTVGGALAALLCAAWTGPSADQAGEARAAPAQTSFERANALYRRGEFEPAAELYRHVLAVLPESVPARYNLGNALYHQGRTAAALQQYLGVLRRAPRDARARNNAAAARARLATDLPPETREVVARPLERPLDWLSPADLAWAGLGALYLIALLGALALLRPRRRRVAATGAAVILLAVAAFGAVAGLAWMRRAEALTVVPDAQARAGPSADRAVVLALPEGAALRVRAERAGWAFVSLPNGLSGWVPRGEIGVIP